jgi:hypothetical protein
MSLVLAGIPGVLVYQDDILISGKEKTQQDALVKEVLSSLLTYGFHVNRKKCQFGVKSTDFLGHIVTHEGIQPKLDNVSAITKMPSPENVSKLRTFLGMCAFYSKFIHNYAAVRAPLYALLHKETPFDWNA